jgi:hypothetical protein
MSELANGHTVILRDGKTVNGYYQGEVKPSARIYINKMFHPKEMCGELSERVNTASTEV